MCKYTLININTKYYWLSPPQKKQALANNEKRAF